MGPSATMPRNPVPTSHLHCHASWWERRHSSMERVQGLGREQGKRFCVTRAGNKLQRFLDGMLLFSHMLLGFMQEVTGQGLWTALPEEVWSDEQHLMA